MQTTFVLAITGQKGGIGKSPVAINLGIQLSQAHDHRVAIIDADEQKTVIEFSGKRTSKKIGDPENPFFLQADKANLTKRIDVLKQEGYSFIIIDTRGSDDSMIRTAMANADLALVPVTPEPECWWPCAETAKRIMVLNKPYFFFLSKVTGGMPQLRKIKAALKERLSTPTKTVEPVIAPALLSRSVLYSDAYLAGQSVPEFSPWSGPAEDLRAFATWVNDNAVAGVQKAGKATTKRKQAA